MAQWRKEVAPEPEGLIQIPGSHMMEGENSLTSCPLTTTQEHTQKKSM